MSNLSLAHDRAPRPAGFRHPTHAACYFCGYLTEALASLIKPDEAAYHLECLFSEMAKAGREARERGRA